MTKRGKGRTATTAEWVLAAVGAIVTLATIGFLVYEGVAEPGAGAPDLLVETGAATRQGGGWAVPVEARNVGSATAASVRIVGELRDAARVVEESEMTLDYVPEASSRTGTLLFRRDPSAFALEVRATGYELP
jgi:uncharacterized protein (TIGR02588 family)